MVTVVVAAALTDGAGRVLMAKRPLGKQHGGLWEFPGGKVEAGEAPAAALARELLEELDISLEGEPMPVAFSEGGGEGSIVLLLYRCRAWRGEPRAIEAEEIRWVAVDDLAALAMPPADVPLAKTLAAER